MTHEFWGEIVYIIFYLMNRCPTKAVEDKTPFELWSIGVAANHLLIISRCLVLFVMHMLQRRQGKNLMIQVRSVFLWDLAHIPKVILYNLKKKKVHDSL